jgi:hypothetical protein
MEDHSSHENSTKKLQFSDNTGISIICLPNRTAQELQPLARAPLTT